METSPIEKLTQLFGLALANGLCKNKSDFAELIGMDNSSISHAKYDGTYRGFAGIQSLFGSDTRYET